MAAKKKKKSPRKPARAEKTPDRGPARGDIPHRRSEEIVRRYLELLSDNPGNKQKTGQKSIESVASNLHVDADKLRAFRDGNSFALDRDAVAMFSKMLGNNTDGMAGITIDDSAGFADPSTGGWYGQMIDHESIRTAKLRTFALIDKTRSEAHSALNCYADLGVTGNVGETSRYGGGFEPVVFDGSIATKDMFAKEANNINQILFPDDQKWQAMRGMCKYGDQYGELGLGVRNGRQYIDRFRPLHARSMQIHRGPGMAFDPTFAFKQVIPGQLDPIAKFPAWQIAHFKNTVGWGDLYGEAIFDCGLRAWMQVESMEASMIVRRLERASLRLKHTLDLGMADSEEQMKKMMDDYRASNTKIRTIDNSKNMRNQKVSMPVEGDHIVGKRTTESPADISILDGDQYIEAIGDFVHFFNKWLSGLGPPKAHLGYEGDDSKTGVNDKHIVFARKVRAMQLKFIASGLNHLYWVSMILRGIDPRSVRYVIFPPSLGTRDELIAAQVQLAHATTIQYLAKAFGQSGKQPSIGWFLKYVMGYDDEVVESLKLPGMLVKVQSTNPGGAGAGFKNDPPANAKEEAEFEAMAEAAKANPELTGQRSVVEFLLEERMIAERHPKMVAKLWIEQQKMTKPFSGFFGDAVRSMGITELRRAA